MAETHDAYVQGYAMGLLKSGTVEQCEKKVAGLKKIAALLKKRAASDAGDPALTDDPYTYARFNPESPISLGGVTLPTGGPAFMEEVRQKTEESANALRGEGGQLRRQAAGSMGGAFSKMMEAGRGNKLGKAQALTEATAEDPVARGTLAADKKKYGKPRSVKVPGQAGSVATPGAPAAGGAPQEGQTFVYQNGEYVAQAPVEGSKYTYQNGKYVPVAEEQAATPATAQQEKFWGGPGGPSFEDIERYYLEMTGYTPAQLSAQATAHNAGTMRAGVQNQQLAGLREMLMGGR